MVGGGGQAHVFLQWFTDVIEKQSLSIIWKFKKKKAWRTYSKIGLEKDFRSFETQVNFQDQIISIIHLWRHLAMFLLQIFTD